MSHPADLPAADADRRPGDGGHGQLVNWPTSVALAVAGTVAAVALIALFTWLVDEIGDFWSQVIAFLAVFAAVLWLAVRDRRKDVRDPARRRRGASITPSGLPGPFVFTQAVGVLGITMLASGLVIGTPRGLLWIGSSIVLMLVGAVGLAFWLAGLRGRGGVPRRPV